jgi:hypothetical protein
MVSFELIHRTQFFQRLVGVGHSNAVLHRVYIYIYIYIYMHENTCTYHRITTIHIVSRDVSPLRLVQRPWIIRVHNNHNDLYPFLYTRHNFIHRNTFVNNSHKTWSIHKQECKTLHAFKHYAQFLMSPEYTIWFADQMVTSKYYVVHLTIHIIMSIHRGGWDTYLHKIEICWVLL